MGYVIAYIEGGGLIDRDGRFRVGDEVRTSIPNKAKMPNASFLPSPQIVNVNGVSLRGLGMEEARNVLKQANRSKSVDLTVARDESEETVSYNKHTSFVRPLWFLPFHHLKANSPTPPCRLRC